MSSGSGLKRCDGAAGAGDLGVNYLLVPSIHTTTIVSVYSDMANHGGHTSSALVSKRVHA